MHLTMVPGIGGSNEAHWQSLWQGGEPDVSRISPSSWDDPELENWMEALDAAAGPRRGDTILVAHSLGCLAAAEWLLRHPGGARGVLLVAPPDPAEPEFPDSAASFRNPRLQPLPVPALLVASENDPYCPLPAARVLALGWDVPLIDAGPFTHLNDESGIGDWPQGRHLLTAFAAGLGASVFSG
ncbi:alpha/beta fold hydrolase [Arthrobacter sp. zg-Y1219]|uniref:RBBP9/YdeN family alpha/beta hydrolase n=1 Tax=Arthrobacter sp. zg-Y1219 TaxID=3049067 RepID=UPI0024C27D7A|nr:alpha/beta hydrolase [Arthrobacter sp. zg-Y1219]MDK1359914.1 alpha/beta fold hydrolase [Arthrobacter sp. zg-Y1219]